MLIGVLKHRTPLAREGGIFLTIFFFLTMDFCLCGAILNLKAFYFGAIPDNDSVDNLWECATKQAVMTVAQWHRN